MAKYSVFKASAYTLAVLLSVASLIACGGSGGQSVPDSSSVQNTSPSIQQLSIQNTSSDQSLIGSVLIPNYQYFDAENDLEGGSSIQWLRGGELIEGKDGPTYIVTLDDVGKEIQVKVTPVALTGALVGEHSISEIIFIENSAPKIQQLSLIDVNGNEAFVGDVLTVSYQYLDIEEDVEGATKVRWMRDAEIIAGASGLNYDLTSEDLNKKISVEVKPIALTGNAEGITVTANSVPVYQRKFLPVTEVSISSTDFELWQLSGSGKLSLIKDINPTGGSIAETAIPFGSQFVFTANDGVHGMEPWITDGTAENTRLLKDINNGTGSSVYSFYRYKTLGNKLYFIANDGIHGQELWMTDGSREGTLLVADINPGVANSDIGEFLSLNGKLLFSANDSVHGRELWGSDGTAEGTALVKDIRTSDDTYSIGTLYEDNVIEYKNEMYFSLNGPSYQTDLWKTDGTPDGTVLVKSLSLSSLSKFKLGKNDSILSENKMCIFYRTETYRSSGKYNISLHCLNELGDDLVQIDLAVELDYGARMLTLEGDLFTTGTMSDGKKGLLKLDGSLSGGQLLIENNNIEWFDINVKYNEKIIFTVNHNELWQVGESKEDSILLHGDMNFYDSSPDTYIKFNGKLYFSASSPAGSGEVDICVTDGTSEGTKVHKLLNSVERGSYPSDYFTLGSQFYFFTDRYNDRYTPTLYSSDGSVEGTLPVTQNNSIFQRAHIK